ncbi:MAG: response regulator [bacterium]|nr:response regulator [bacterium]
MAQSAPNLVLLDVGLPDGDGFELARELRVRAPRAAIIFLTAQANPEDRVRGLELGADHCAQALPLPRAAAARAELPEARPEPGRARGRAARGAGGHRPRARRLRALRRRGRGPLAAAARAEECAVLRLLASRVGKAVSRDGSWTWPGRRTSSPTSRTVDNFIVRLRSHRSRSRQPGAHPHRCTARVPPARWRAR